MIGVIYKVTFNKNTEEFKTLHDAVKSIYCHIFDSKCILDKLKLELSYYSVQTSIFSVHYDDGLILKNSENTIKLRSFFPQFGIYDIIYKNKSQQKIINAKNRCPLIQLQKEPAVSTKEPTIITKEPDVNTKELNIIMRPGMSNNNLNIFSSDKKSYVKIKNDIINGYMTKNNIHPMFMMKYQIFQILDSRNVVNFESDEKIMEEYNLFHELYEECQEDNKPTTETIPAVWVPPNYHYLSDQDKTNYAARYSLTQKEFEDRYINGLVDDVNIYFSKKKSVEETDSESSNEN